jgi:outer membrane PBP1 activator LpoA protein
MKAQRTFLISLVMLMSVVFTACVQVSPEESIETAPQQPEAAPVTIEEKVTPSDSEIFAANPELMAARRHAIEADDETPTGSELYAANPELMAAHRYSAPSIEAGVEAGSTFFANNPELMVAERYTVEDETITDSEMLAANPELKVVRQYQAAIEK